MSHLLPLFTCFLFNFCTRNPLMLNKGVIFCACGTRINTEVSEKIYYYLNLQLYQICIVLYCIKKSIFSSQVSSVDMALALGARGCESESHQYKCSCVLEIPLDKELTAYCLVETCTKLKELIPAVMLKYGLDRVQLPLWL